jgi:hypothetical protein
MILHILPLFFIGVGFEALASLFILLKMAVKKSFIYSSRVKYLKIDVGSN